MTHGLPIRLGISSCLLGQQVRYDGGHKRDAFITQTLAEHVEFLPLCPEVAIGLGIPRPPIRLVQTEAGVRALGVDAPHSDVTDQLVAYAKQMLDQLAGLSGYIFKKKSPSCGMERVKVYGADGQIVGVDSGRYALTIMRALPELPVEEEGRLNDPALRENFIERVFVYHRWQQLLHTGLTPSALVAFHTQHKFNVLAHDEVIYRELGRLVAQAGNRDLGELSALYIRELMTALKQAATAQRHANVLMHIMGYVKQQLDSADKAELLQVIDAYRRQQVPLIVPITLLQHHLRRHPDDYIAQQYYLNPHPRELMLRNHV